MLGDIDRQHSARQWLRLRPPDLPPIHTWDVDAEDVARPPRGTTHAVHPDYDHAIERELDQYFDRYMTVRKDNQRLADDEIRDGGRGALEVHATRPA